MNRNLLIVGAAVAAVAAGGVSAATHHKMNGSDRYAAPSQPIPYSQLDDYMKASPKARTEMLAQSSAPAGASGMAPTGSAADTSATVKSDPAETAPAQAGDAPKSDMSAPSSGADTGAVNPPADGKSNSMTPATPSATPDTETPSATPPK